MLDIVFLLNQRDRLDSFEESKTCLRDFVFVRQLRIKCRKCRIFLALSSLSPGTGRGMGHSFFWTFRPILDFYARHGGEVLLITALFHEPRPAPWPHGLRLPLVWHPLGHRPSSRADCGTAARPLLRPSAPARPRSRPAPSGSRTSCESALRLPASSA